MININSHIAQVAKPGGISEVRETGIYKAYRSILQQDRLKELSTLKPWIPIMHTALMWFGIFAAWALVACYPTWWAVLIAIPVIGTRYYGLFIIGHDGMHRRVLNKPAENDLFCDLFILGPVGAITRINNKNHLEHHQHLSTELDPDRHKHACFNKSTAPEYLFFLSGLMSLVPAIKNVYGGRKSKDKPKKTRVTGNANYTARDLVILLGWQLALISGLTISIGWWAYPVLWLLPVYLHSYLGDLLRSFLEHAHPESDEKADKHRLITYTSNPLERIFFAPMNMNYHAAHHLWTSIPYYNLPKADALLKTHPKSEELVWRKSYLGFAFRYLFALPLPECQRKAEASHSAQT
jgi:fatty acid desaturase